jgi:hypothetical protein
MTMVLMTALVLSKSNGIKTNIVQLLAIRPTEAGPSVRRILLGKGKVFFFSLNTLEWEGNPLSRLCNGWPLVIYVGI